VDVVFRATGVEQVRRGLKLVTGDAQVSGRQTGLAMRQLAGGIENIARSGQAGGAALKLIIAQGAEMAFMFGATGPIVGALAVTGLAIYEHITGKMKEAADQVKAFHREVEGLTDLGGAAARQARIYSGGTAIRDKDESDAKYLARSQGLKGVRGRIDQIQRSMAAAGVPVGDVSRMGQGATGLGYGGKVDKMGRELAELVEHLARLKTEFAEITPITQKLADAEGERAKGLMSIAGDEAAKKNAALRAGDIESFLSQNRGMPGVQAAGGRAPGILELIAKYVNVERRPDLTGSASAGSAQALNPIVANFAENVQKPLGEAIRSGMASTIGGAITDGITAGFEDGGITGAFKAAGKAILAGIGGIMTQMGEVWLSYGISMTALGSALWNPFTSGPAAIGIGAALIALGATLGAVAHGGRGGGGGSAGGGYSSSAPQIIDRGTIDPTAVGRMGNMSARPTTNNHFTIIGTKDPTAQREIMELIGNAQRRG
jgi:hypothetical protein